MDSEKASRRRGTWGRCSGAFDGQGGNEQDSSQDFLLGEEQGRRCRLGPHRNPRTHLTEARGGQEGGEGRLARQRGQTVEGFARRAQGSRFVL